MKGTKALASNLEKNYDIKVFCDIGCDNPNTYVLDLDKSLEDNLSELAKTAGVVYKREQMKIRKVVFSIDE